MSENAFGAVNRVLELHNSDHVNRLLALKWGGLMPAFRLIETFKSVSPDGDETLCYVVGQVGPVTCPRHANSDVDTPDLDITTTKINAYYETLKFRCPTCGDLDAKEIKQ